MIDTAMTTQTERNPKSLALQNKNTTHFDSLRH